jgi:hypothetical protein
MNRKSNYSLGSKKRQLTSNLKTHFDNTGRNGMTSKDKSDISVQFDTDDSVNQSMEDAQVQATVNRSKADNPELPRKFIQEVLLAEADVNNGLYKPYMRKSIKG